MIKLKIEKIKTILRLYKGMLYSWTAYVLARGFMRLIDTKFIQKRVNLASERAKRDLWDCYKEASIVIDNHPRYCTTLRHAIKVLNAVL